MFNDAVEILRWKLKLDRSVGNIERSFKNHWRQCLQFVHKQGGNMCAFLNAVYPLSIWNIPLWSYVLRITSRTVDVSLWRNIAVTLQSRQSGVEGKYWYETQERRGNERTDKNKNKDNIRIWEYSEIVLVYAIKTCGEEGAECHSILTSVSAEWQRFASQPFKSTETALGTHSNRVLGKCEKGSRGSGEKNNVSSP